MVDEEPDQSPLPKGLEDHLHPCHKQSSSEIMRINVLVQVGSKRRMMPILLPELLLLISEVCHQHPKEAATSNLAV
jgi:hypothetical protein